MSMYDSISVHTQTRTHIHIYSGQKHTNISGGGEEKEGQ